MASRGYSLGVVRGLLVTVASLVAEHRLEGEQAQWLGHVGSTLPGPGVGSMFLNWQVDS